MKTGLFGGTFDPVHLGHLIVAETVRSDFPLDRILFIPAAFPFHKVERNISSTKVRLEMLELAVENHPQFGISDIEIKRGGVSYTIETIKCFLESEEWKKDEFFLLMGTDSLLELGTWKAPDSILKDMQTLVLERPGFDINLAEERFRNKVTTIQTPHVNISSTEIRQRIRVGKSIKYWVPEKVEIYIHQKGLYR